MPSLLEPLRKWSRGQRLSFELKNVIFFFCFILMTLSCWTFVFFSNSNVGMATINVVVFESAQWEVIGSHGVISVESTLMKLVTFQENKETTELLWVGIPCLQSKKRTCSKNWANPNLDFELFSFQGCNKCLLVKLWYLTPQMPALRLSHSHLL